MGEAGHVSGARSSPPPAFSSSSSGGKCGGRVVGDRAGRTFCCSLILEQFGFGDDIIFVGSLIEIVVLAL